MLQQPARGQQAAENRDDNAWSRAALPAIMLSCMLSEGRSHAGSRCCLQPPCHTAGCRECAAVTGVPQSQSKSHQAGPHWCSRSARGGSAWARGLACSLHVPLRLAGQWALARAAPWAPERDLGGADLGWRRGRLLATCEALVVQRCKDDGGAQPMRWKRRVTQWANSLGHHRAWHIVSAVALCSHVTQGLQSHAAFGSPWQGLHNAETQGTACCSAHFPNDTRGGA